MGWKSKNSLNTLNMEPTVNNPAQEIGQGKRFEFGKNWEGFLKVLDETRISEAEKSIKKMLGMENLENKRFLDIGSGSGLFSLAARRLGATVYSFDYDPRSVACTEELKRRYFPDDENWNIGQGNVLDASYLNVLGRYDVVYAWGVLHHTGKMWTALENVVPLVNEKGTLFISIYNDQGLLTQFWKFVKKFYNRSSAPVRAFIVLWVGASLETVAAMIRLLRCKNPLPFESWKEKKKRRGMSEWHDLVDWVGGYPFEAAKPEEIFEFCREKGFLLERLKTCGGGSGCNEFVFVRRERYG
jgi:2-polyprenyl-3-methyl-5-hydroxy-6-metoxy-1,4-benzoquinol methylase